MRIVALIALLCFGCAFGQASANPCYARGFAIGRGKVHVTCTPSRHFEAPIEDPPKIAMPIAECPGNYNYFHECIDDVSGSNMAKADVGEGYIEIAGAPPTTGFWSTVFDFLVAAGTLAATYFKFGG